ncbi:secondary thiamine-phosphate synthase enzyme YjbQ [Alteromonas sp. ASW11-130]|uniref:secondary thiamine-phosphate synthase enzyme YjbQ n=1 Tax=Alteromonas sp. ASW11-130 TaxID=3015775 RepID=UPI002242AE21|nr:secondary thiamine-phosphate synthase enzyme YjbQ [Alteromonas sp. ASW11-130]MCW8090784.1 secondary thiamine-phosphate synthase enzyme YjbQ [Alteromonas sp. ASW11-130]
MWYSSTLSLSPKSRGFHLVTDEITSALPQIQKIEMGLLHLFLQHTSASLCINENADPSVRRDLEQWFNRNVRENEPYYEHTCEGSDDMPAHIKSSLLGCELSIPVRDGKLQLGTWQGILLGEHRDHGGARKVVATLYGSEF